MKNLNSKKMMALAAALFALNISATAFAAEISAADAKAVAVKVVPASAEYVATENDLKDKDFDVLYLTDYVDEFAVMAIQTYEEKAFQNVESGDLDLDTEEEKKETEKVNKDNEDLLKDMVSVLSEVEEVKFTNKLKSHPVCLTSQGDVSIEMQKVFDAMPNDMGIKAQTILEINKNHPLVTKLKDLYRNNKEELKNYTKILYSQARLIEGLSIDNPTEISNLICELMSKQ
jgi:molecular chaperone HtpG